MIFDFIQLQYTKFNKNIMSLSSPLTVIGMVNGMIGGFILILPVNALKAGFIYSLLVILIIGAFSFYSCYLCVAHLGDQKDLDHVMYKHFNKSNIIKIIYDLTVFSNLLFLGFLYFDLICIQWQGITRSDSLVIPLVNTAVLFILIFVLKYFQFGATIMAYGIVSIIGYVIFLIWVMATAPNGQKQWTPFGTGEFNLAAAMGGAYSIQTFFIPVLKRNPKQQKYVFFTMLANVIGGSVYLYIAFMGSFGILNRSFYLPDPSTIEDYFPPGKLQVMIIQILYLVHLYSVFPQFTLISKKRIFAVFRLTQTKKGKIPLPQIIYSIIFVGVCLLINLLKVKINTIVNINGSVIGFFFIYFLPAILHIRCQYFAKNKITLQQKRKLNLNYPQNQSNNDQNNKEANANLQLTALDHHKQTQKQSNSRQQSVYHTIRSNSNRSNLNQLINNSRKQTRSELIIEKSDLNQDYYACDCKKPKKMILQIIQLIVLTVMIFLGGFILVNGIMSVS